jgi:hypothetical protein
MKKPHVRAETIGDVYDEKIEHDIRGGGLRTIIVMRSGIGGVIEFIHAFVHVPDKVFKHMVEKRLITRISHFTYHTTTRFIVASHKATGVPNPRQNTFVIPP